VVEIVCAYLLVSLFANLEKLQKKHYSISDSKVRELLAEHPQWDEGTGWKNWLNNLRLISPILLFQPHSSLAKVFPIPQLSLGFPRLLRG